MDVLKKTTGPCIVLAGAGTGKTRLMVEKVKHLIQGKIYKPEKIACITFSNEAANNLASRIRAALPDVEQEPTVKTFHSFSAYLLKEHLPKEKQNFQTLTPDDSKILLHTNLRVPPMNCHRYIDTIGKAKDLGVTIQKLQNHLKEKTHNKPIQNLKDDLETIQTELLIEKDKVKKKKIADEAIRIRELIDLSRFISIFEAYEKIKEQKNALDYSDLNNKAVELLKKNPSISGKFEYIIVDEFQDTNRIQLELLKLISPKRNITVVGDMNQSIYRFRGAYEANIDWFKKTFNVAPQDIFSLEKSYRSPNKILRIAHTLIKNNYASEEDCFEVQNAHKKEGKNIRIIETKNSKEEARKVVEIIKEKIANKETLEEICVMARTHQQLAMIKKALSDSQVPFHSVGQESLLKQNSIKKIVSYLSIVSNLIDKNNKGWNSWWDSVHEEEFLKEDFIKITTFLKENRDSENYNVKIFTTLQNLNLSELGEIKLKTIFSRIKSLIPENGNSLEEIITKACNVCGFTSEDFTKVDKEALLNINKFQEFAKKYAETHAGKLTDFINHLEILNTLNITLETARIEDKGVRLMTSHSTKGLEFETIILTNLAQKRFPLERITKNKLLPNELFQDQSIDLEDYERKHLLFEERRLCYVSFTRSKSELIITFAQEYASKKSAPSRFFEEINYKENPDIEFSQDLEEKAITIEPNISTTLPREIKVSSERTLSPSALNLFEDCQKKFEYKYVYNMPEKITTSWDAIKMGSFIHIILEKGVKSKFTTLEAFINLAKDLKNKEEWESVELEEALPLIKVFYDRNKNKYSPDSLTEKKLFTEISGLKFMGVADRIDHFQDGLEIIDYKTGKTVPSGKKRNWQLGYYALAARPLGKVKKLTLDVFQSPQLLEYTIKENGDVINAQSNRLAFNLHEVEAELIETGNKIKEAYAKGFKSCPIEKNCEFCREYVY
ncbi:MAG: ATP-dependent DNA helicase [archaeon]